MFDENKEFRDKVISRCEDILGHLFKNGVYRNGKFYVGNVHGDSGKSLNVELAGEKRGLWFDFASGESGDIFDLWAKRHGLDSRADFPCIVEEISNLLGIENSFEAKKKVVIIRNIRKSITG